MTSALLVTGASGQLGRRVLELLLDQGALPLIATTRHPDKLADLAARGVEVRRADFEDADLVSAFSGAERALLISTDAAGAGRRVAHHRAAIAALEGAGVKHVVYTSMINSAEGSMFGVAAAHRETEAVLARSVLDFTVLRNGVYADSYLRRIPYARASGKLTDARGGGRVAFVSREDCARTAVAALLEPLPGRRTFDVTGSAELSSEDITALLGELWGRSIQHASVTPDVLKERLFRYHESFTPEDIEVLVSLDMAIERGELSGVSNTVEALTGRPAQSMRDFLVSHGVANMTAGHAAH